MAHEIFISYAKEDHVRAAELASVLEAKGWSVWWDRQIPPGRTFDDVIEEALTKARCVIVLWSASSVTSRWVRTEASVAADRGILVPALIDDVAIPLEFRRLEAARLIEWRGQPDDEELGQLLETVGRLVSQAPPQPSAPHTAAPRAFLRTFRMPQILIPLVTFAAGSAVTYLLMFRSAHPAPASQTPVQSGRAAPTPEPAAATSSASNPVKGRLDLLAQKNGGHLAVAPNETWNVPIDGKEEWDYVKDAGKEAVYAFKDDRPATFDTFGMLIGETHDWNVKQFELLVGNDGPTGRFESVGTFETKNLRQFPSPWQDFTFPATRAKYFKVRVISTYTGFPYAVAREWRLLGSF